MSERQHANTGATRSGLYLFGRGHAASTFRVHLHADPCKPRHHVPKNLVFFAGRARDTANPAFTGSAPATITIGTNSVVLLATVVAVDPRARARRISCRRAQEPWSRPAKEREKVFAPQSTPTRRASSVGEWNSLR